MVKRVVQTTPFCMRIPPAPCSPLPPKLQAKRWTTHRDASGNKGLHESVCKLHRLLANSQRAMHSALYRTNALLTFAGTMLAGMCLLTTITDYFHVANPIVDCSYLGVEGLQREFGHDRAYIILNLTADLRSEFTWNTKQIFAYVNIEFETEKNKENQMVMWSAIIQKPEDALLQIPNLRQQYPYAVTDQGFYLRGRPFNVTVSWNMMPRVGVLYTRHKTFTGFTLPVDYSQPAVGRMRTGGGGSDN